jgi:hypothetical protein
MKDSEHRHEDRVRPRCKPLRSQTTGLANLSLMLAQADRRRNNRLPFASGYCRNASPARKLVKAHLDTFPEDRSHQMVDTQVWARTFAHDHDHVFLATTDTSLGLE